MIWMSSGQEFILTLIDSKLLILCELLRLLKFSYHIECSIVQRIDRVPDTVMHHVWKA